jgi:hypothetical protein
MLHQQWQPNNHLQQSRPLEGFGGWGSVWNSDQRAACAACHMEPSGCQDASALVNVLDSAILVAGTQPGGPCL